MIIEVVQVFVMLVMTRCEPTFIFQNLSSTRKESQLLHIELWYIKLNDIMEFYMGKFNGHALLLYSIL
jgi:hypothetical protein